MNTVKRSRISLIAALLPLTALPVVGHAADPGMDACIQAFISSNIDKGQPVTVRKLASFDNPFIQGGDSEVHLTAKSKVTGKQLAKAVCVVDRNGVVLTLNGAPVQPKAILSSR